MSGRQARTNSGPGSGASTTSNCPGHGDAAATNPTDNDQETPKETMDTDDQDSKTDWALQEVSPRIPYRLTRRYKWSQPAATRASTVTHQREPTTKRKTVSSSLLYRCGNVND
ncbi:hypothetical protein MTO96_046164 [Rhipicephalus appendiculatus]